MQLWYLSKTLVIDQLERSGYVSRIADVEDRRVWRIVPSQLANSRKSEIDRAGRRVAGELFADFNDKDLRDLRRCLEKLVPGAR